MGAAVHPMPDELKGLTVEEIADRYTGRFRDKVPAYASGGWAPGDEAEVHRLELLPDPGEGPKDELVRNGFYKIEIHARDASGGKWVARVEAQGDPGYGATSVILGESALCLGLDAANGSLPDRAGVLTPATGMGTRIAERLRAAGQTFEVARA